MSGHSKWANIKHKKEKTDAQKAKIFTKIGKEITIAVKSGGGDPNVNSKLRDLIAKAKANNVPPVASCLSVFISGVQRFGEGDLINVADTAVVILGDLFLAAKGFVVGAHQV